MGENATEAMYMAIYIFVFIIALSATISMFYMVNSYAETSYEYGKKIDDKALIENVPTTTYRVVTGNQLISYYYNYIKNVDSNSVYNYKITVQNENGTTLKLVDNANNNEYSQLLKSVNPASKYYLKYNKVTTDSNGKYQIDILIKKANQEELSKINV